MQSKKKLKFSIIDIDDLHNNPDLVNNYMCKNDGYIWGSIAKKTYNLPVKCIIIYGSNVETIGCIWTYSMGNNSLISLRNSLIISDVDYETIILELTSFCKSLNITLKGFFINPYLENNNIIRSSKRNIQLSLSLDIDMCWKSLPKKTRNMVRKGLKTSLEISDKKENLNDFYNIYVKNMLRKKVIPHSIDFFENMMGEFKSDVDLITTIYKGRVIGGIIVQYGDKVANYPFHSSIIDFNHLAPNHLLVWSMIERCVARGIGSIDMGEATEGSGVYNFKKSFGGVVHYIGEYVIISGNTKKDLSNTINKFQNLAGIKEILVNFLYGLLSIIPIRVKSKIIKFKKRRVGLGI
jgi:hypothetical protein